MRRTLGFLCAGLAFAGLSAHPLHSENTARADDPKAGAVLANKVFTAADDFVVEVYHNGEKVPDAKRTMLEERFGATAERIDIDVRQGDWLAFNVVNNRFRWEGASYFGVVGKGDDGVVFVSDPGDSRWSACDDFGHVSDFIRKKDHLADHRARLIERAWGDGDAIMNGFTDGGWKGKPVWGATHNTWIKFIVR